MPEALPPGSIIGILGGGQLGRMLSLAAARLGLKTHIYSDEPDVPAFDVRFVGEDRNAQVSVDTLLDRAVSGERLSGAEAMRLANDASLSMVPRMTLRKSMPSVT